MHPSDLPTTDLLILALIFLPFIVSMLGAKRGGGGWKFTTFALCLLTLLLALPLTILAIICWLLAWGTEIAARSAIQKQSIAEATLLELRQQNKMLRGENSTEPQEQPKSPRWPF